MEFTIPTRYDEYYVSICKKHVCIQSFEYTIFDSKSLVGYFPELRLWLLGLMGRESHTSKYYDVSTCTFVD